MNLFECNCGKGNMKFNGKNFVCNSCGISKDVILDNLDNRNKLYDIHMDETPLARFTLVPGDKLIISVIKDDKSKMVIEREMPIENIPGFLVNSIEVDLFFKAKMRLENK